MSESLINTEALRQLIREELRAMQSEESKTVEEKGGDEELTVREVAKLKGVKPRTVYGWVAEKRILFHRTPGGQLRFYRRHVEGVISPN
jgi:excisionase family DNA binding protein